MTKFILSVSGGGIKGAAVVSFLVEFEKFLAGHNGNSLYDQFDIYTGTSTGALITSGIAYMGMDSSKLSEFYTHEIGKKIMNKTWEDYIFGIFQTRPMYDGVGKKKLIQEICQGITTDQTDKDVLIPIYDITNKKPVFIKSWDNKQQSLSLILDATTACPVFYPSIEYEKNVFVIDGGVSCNNPAMVAYIEAKNMYPNEKIVLISIGTGFNKNKIGIESKKWGFFNWELEGNLSKLFLDAPMEVNVEYTKKMVESRGDIFLHIDGFLENTSFNDISQKNLDKLNKFGKDLWINYKNRLLRIFDKKEAIFL